MKICVFGAGYVGLVSAACLAEMGNSVACVDIDAARVAGLNQGGHAVAMVPVAAILVASIRLHFLDVLLHLRYRGPHEIPCRKRFNKGEEIGWFQHGSTIIVFAPRGFGLCEGIEAGATIRMGRALMHLPPQEAAAVSV